MEYNSQTPLLFDAKTSGSHVAWKQNGCFFLIPDLHCARPYSDIYSRSPESHPASTFQKTGQTEFPSLHHIICHYVSCNKYAYEKHPFAWHWQRGVSRIGLLYDFISKTQKRSCRQSISHPELARSESCRRIPNDLPWSSLHHMS